MSKLLSRATVQHVHFNAGSGNTGKGTSWTVTIAKNGVDFTAGSSTVSELSGGWYDLLTSVFDTSTAGALTFKLAASGVTIYEDCQVGYLDGIANAISQVDAKLGDGNTDLADEVAAVQRDIDTLLLRADPILQFPDVDQSINEKIKIRRGDSYTGTIRNGKISFTVRTYTDIATGTAYLTAKSHDLVTTYWTKSVTPVLLDQDDSGYVFELAFSLAAADTAALSATTNTTKMPRWDMSIEKGTDKDTPYSGVFEVIEQVRA